MGRREFVSQVIADWARTRPDEDLSNLEAVQLLIWAGRLADEWLQQATRVAGLTNRGDYEVLALLRRNEPEQLTPAEVALSLLTSQSGMTGKVDRLENLELLERRPDKHDRRIVRLQLTDRGRRKTDEAFQMFLRIYEEMLTKIPEGEVSVLTQMLNSVVARLDDGPPSRQHPAFENIVP